MTPQFSSSWGARSTRAMATKVGEIKEVLFGGEYVLIRRSAFSKMVAPVGALEHAGDRLTIPRTSMYLDSAPKVDAKHELSEKDRTDIDAQLEHHIDGFSPERPGVRAGAEDHEVVSCFGTQQAYSDLTAGGVAGAEEEDCGFGAAGKSWSHRFRHSCMALEAKRRLERRVLTLTPAPVSSQAAPGADQTSRRSYSKCSPVPGSLNRATGGPSHRAPQPLRLARPVFDRGPGGGVASKAPPPPTPRLPLAQAVHDNLVS